MLEAHAVVEAQLLAKVERITQEASHLVVLVVVVAVAKRAAQLEVARARLRHLVHRPHHGAARGPGRVLKRDVHLVGAAADLREAQHGAQHLGRAHDVAAAEEDTRVDAAVGQALAQRELVHKLVELGLAFQRAAVAQGVGHGAVEGRVEHGARGHKRAGGGARHRHEALLHLGQHRVGAAVAVGYYARPQGQRTRKHARNEVVEVSKVGGDVGVDVQVLHAVLAVVGQRPALAQVVVKAQAGGEVAGVRQVFGVEGGEVGGRAVGYLGAHAGEQVRVGFLHAGGQPDVVVEALAHQRHRHAIVVVQVLGVEADGALLEGLGQVELELAALVEGVAGVARPVGVAVEAARVVAQAVGANFVAVVHVGAVVGLLAVAFQAKAQAHLVLPFGHARLGQKVEDAARRIGARDAGRAAPHRLQALNGGVVAKEVVGRNRAARHRRHRQAVLLQRYVVVAVGRVGQRAHRVGRHPARVHHVVHLPGRCVHVHARHVLEQVGRALGHQPVYLLGIERANGHRRFHAGALIKHAGHDYLIQAFGVFLQHHGHADCARHRHALRLAQAAHKRNAERVGAVGHARNHKRTVGVG